MLWGTVIKNKEKVEINIRERERCERMLCALQSDEGTDRYLDEQPGGGGCLAANRHEQEKYKIRLNALYDLKTVFPQAKAKDILILEYFMEKAALLSRGPQMFEHCEMADCLEQAFVYYERFSSHQITKESVDDFCRLGEAIVKDTVRFDDEKEEFYLTGADE